MKKLIINTDGGSRNNPGKAAAAFIISDEDSNNLFSEGEYLGIATNNEAEYNGVKLALERVEKEFIQELPLEIEVRADSKLVVEQLSGNFKVKSPKVKVLFDKVKKLEERVGEVNYFYIPRAENWEADLLVNQILDENS